MGEGGDSMGRVLSSEGGDGVDAGFVLFKVSLWSF
jgi:hypothetical protein